jgi:hypothetical protein
VRSRARYQILEKDGDRVLTCAHSANVRVCVVRGLTVTPSTRKRYARDSIFLDGVYSDAPFLDDEARQYSLDHHKGCIRPFTLATCEQALVMVLEGLPLDEDEWNIYINDPDLDAVFAAWVLLNHAELKRDHATLRRDVMRLLRVEGTIDAQGFQHAAILTAFPKELYDATLAKIDALRHEERELKSTGAWNEIDLVDYTRRLLESIDRLLLPDELLNELLAVETIEIARRSLQRHKVAVLCRSEAGMYAAQAELKERYGDKIAVIILDLGNGRYTLRQIDLTLTRTLEDAYPVLNRLDSHARADDRWNGTRDMGGSPQRAGTSLSGEEIADVIAEVYAEGGWLRFLWRGIARVRARDQTSRTRPST